jgi:hypothetical protein
MTIYQAEAKACEEAMRWQEEIGNDPEFQADCADDYRDSFPYGLTATCRECGGSGLLADTTLSDWCPHAVMCMSCHGRGWL